MAASPADAVDVSFLPMFGLADEQRVALEELGLVAVDPPEPGEQGGQLESFIAVLRLAAPEVVTDAAAQALRAALRDVVVADAMRPPARREFARQAPRAAAELLGPDIGVVKPDGSVAAAGGGGPRVVLVEPAKLGGGWLATAATPIRGIGGDQANFALKSLPKSGIPDANLVN